MFHFLRTSRSLMFLLVIVVSVLVRLAYINYAGKAIQIELDSQGYYNTGDFYTQDLLHNYFNTNRTPGYNMITSFVISAAGYGHPPYLSEDFFRGAWYIIVLQTIVGVAGLIILFDLLCRIGLSDKWSLAFTLFTGLNVYQFIWEHAFLNYALFITLVTVILRLFVSLLKKPAIATGALFFLASSYAFLLRPAGLALPFILLPFVWYRHKTKKVFVLLAAVLCLYIAVPLSHIVANRLLYDFKGLSINTDFALFGRILKFSIPIDPAVNVQPLYDEVTAYRARGENISIPWYFFVYYNNRIYNHMDELQQFNRLVSKKYWLPLTATVISDIPRVFSDTYVSGVLYRAESPGIMRIFFDSLAGVYAAIQKMTFIFFLLFPVSVWLFIKKRTVFHTFLLAIALLQLYQIISTLTFGGSWDVAGHMITTQTYLFFYCFWCISWIFSRLRRRMIQ